MPTWFTAEDAKIAFNLFCGVYGIGTLGMPANFSRAGPVLAVVAMLFMAFSNVYASVVCSKILLKAPRSVRTYGDLGEWCMGKTGRWLVLLSQMAVCLLMSGAFLVLGGMLLSSLFPGAFQVKTWIVLMAVSVIPVFLTPTMKEGAGFAFAGCLGTLLADIIGVAVLMHGMKGHPSVPKPDISFDQVATTFGNLSLAYGAGLAIPALQRQHSQPERMPRVIGITLTFISCLFLILASTGYSAVGCQISGNLLFTIYADPTTGLTKLGFAPNKGAVVLAFLFMQMHITIAYGLGLHPVFYVFERLLLGMHKRPADDIESLQYAAADTPLTVRPSKGSVVSIADIEKQHDNDADELPEYWGHEYKYIPMRLAILTLSVISGILFKDHFLDLSDFVGASAITIICIILPIVFYLKKLWTAIPVWEKIVGLVIVVICFGFGTYVTIKTGKNLFNPGTPNPNAFPFCHAEFKNTLYYNTTAVHSH